MTDEAQTVTIVGRRRDPDEVSIVLSDRRWAGWVSVRITRGLERMPSDFEIGLTEVFPGETEMLVAHVGEVCEVYIGRDLVLTGYVDRVTPSISPGQHDVTISGRGKCQDLVDCSAEWEGGQIIASSVLEVAQKLADPFKIQAYGELGPAVGKANLSTLIPYMAIMIGETPWEVIERLCRIAGLLAWEQPDGRLLLDVSPGDVSEREIRQIAGVNTRAASGFTEGVNVQRASAQYSGDQRFSEYKAYRWALLPRPDLLGPADNLIGEALDRSVTRHRPRVILAEMNKDMGVKNALDRAAWESARRYGRGHVVTLTTDSWRDAAGKLYAPNLMVPLELKSLHVKGVRWLVSEVTYRKSNATGTECDLTLMPPEAFGVKPTLPDQIMRPDLARAPVAP